MEQVVDYGKDSSLESVLAKIARLPPLVCPGEINMLKEQLREVAEGKRFILQGGDCAESFDYCSQDPIEAKLKVLLQMSLIIVYGARIPILRIGRMAGQYAKPRSNPFETVNGAKVCSYRGDNVNGHELSERKPDPDRLLQAYFHSAATLNYIRSLLSAGFADLHHPESWNMGYIKDSEIRVKYQKIVRRMLDALDFMKLVGVDSTDFGELPNLNAQRRKLLRSVDSFAALGESPTSPQESITSHFKFSYNSCKKDGSSSVDFFTSHEALLLDYETQLTRYVAQEETHYNLGAHFLWCGDRTRQVGGAHVEYLSGIANPIGVKVGPSMVPEDLPLLLEKLNPRREVGKIVLITRFGRKRVSELLPEHIECVQRSGHPVVWICDPMHGNTTTTAEGLKTRNYDDIISELQQTFEAHERCSTHLGGVHFELTGDSVTECVGGNMKLEEQHLSQNYQTFCDPRLNYEQSLDIAFNIADILSQRD